MLKNHRNTLQARPGKPQPLQWADCHIRGPREQVLVRGVVIPHVDSVYPGTRSQAERQAVATPLPSKGNLIGNPGNSSNPANAANAAEPTPPLQR